MSFRLEHRTDKSVALLIDGQLQFDSLDEQIYHECLALPAAALACQRFPSKKLRVLVCGGGDGLLMRELFKCEQIASIDLVERDEAILQLASHELNELNCNSLQDPRLRIHRADAWEHLQNSDREYELLFCDLTVPQDTSSTRMHSVEWYQMLMRRMACPEAVMAVNCASPCKMPAAFWSIVNSVRQAGWTSVKPYRVAIPSFTSAGYGPDWGFLLASNQKIQRHEIESLVLPEPRYRLRNVDSLLRLFSFPAACAEHRSSAEPVFCAGNDLLRDLIGLHENINAVHDDWNSLDFDSAAEFVPSKSVPSKSSEQQQAPQVIPKPVKSLLLSMSSNKSKQTEESDNTLFSRIAELLPQLDRELTRSMVAEFVSFPERFLHSIDLPALLDALIARARELPDLLVSELIYLKQELPNIDLAALSLERIGSRVLAIIALLVILSNLCSPDAAYGKSSFAYYFQGYQIHLLQYPHGFQLGNAYRAQGFYQYSYTDIYGSMLPERFLKLHSAQYYSDLYSNIENSEPLSKRAVRYRLFEDTNILDNGDIATFLNENTVLLVGPAINTIVNVQNGHPLLQVASVPAENAKIATQLDTQIYTIEQAIRQSTMQSAWLNSLNLAGTPQYQINELANASAMVQLLRTARSNLGDLPEPPATEAEAVQRKIAILPGVWTDADGHYLMIHLPNNGYAYMNGRKWFDNESMSLALASPYPKAFRKFMISYLNSQVNNYDARVAEQQLYASEITAHIASLHAEQKQIDDRLARLSSIKDDAEPDTILYGPEWIPTQQAKRRIDAELDSARGELDGVVNRITGLSVELQPFRNLIYVLKRED